MRNSFSAVTFNENWHVGSQGHFHAVFTRDPDVVAAVVENDAESHAQKIRAAKDVGLHGAIPRTSQPDQRALAKM